MLKRRGIAEDVANGSETSPFKLILKFHQ